MIVYSDLSLGLKLNFCVLCPSEVTILSLSFSKKKIAALGLKKIRLRKGFQPLSDLCPLKYRTRLGVFTGV